MNYLANLKTKPASKVNKEVAIIIPKQDTITTTNAATTNVEEAAAAVAEAKDPKEKQEPRIKITDNKDNGQRAAEIKERLKKLTDARVITRNPIAEEKVENKAPVPLIEETPAKKPKKIKPQLVIEEDVELKGVEAGLEVVNEKAATVKEKIVKEKVNRDTEEFKDAYKRAEQAVKTSGLEVVRNFTHNKNVIKTYKTMSAEIHAMHIGDTSIRKRLPVTPPYTLQVSEHYMNNRAKFTEFINGVFDPYKQDLQDETKNISCDDIGKDTGKLGLLTHQKIVREYMNLYTPYRGLLLYHGLGSGKTCSSIAIAEGLKSYRRVIVMTPASLRRNYIEEIKKCGDLLYRKNQFWEWMSIDSNQELIEPLSAALGLPIEYIKTHRGAWLVNVKKPANYSDLSTSDKKSLNNQLDEMINYKYWFINYNGLRRDRFNAMTNGLETNIFDNSVVIIDEAHNLISRIVNKINKASKFLDTKRGPDTVMHAEMALQIYEFLLRAEGCRVVLLTGTPIINYPNEIGILFNILRGYIKTWSFKLTIKKGSLSKEQVLDWFSKEKVMDYIDYISGTQKLTITRNPYGFLNKITKSSGYKGVRYDEHDVNQSSEEGIISDETFIKRTLKVLKDHEIDVEPNQINFTVNTALPDTMDAFVNNFIDKESGEVHNIEKFKRRIIGLTSYFRSAQEELLPRYNKNENRYIVKIPMSDYQFQIYENARHDERKTEKPIKGTKVDSNGLFVQPVSTYKIFSRLYCNFVMPNPPGRPTPADLRHEANADMIDDLLERRQNNRVIEVDDNIKVYLDSFSDEYKADPENMRKIKETITFFCFTCLTVKNDPITLERFLSDEYINILKTGKNRVWEKYHALSAQEKEVLDAEYKDTFAKEREKKKLFDEKDARYEKEGRERQEREAKKDTKGTKETKVLKGITKETKETKEIKEVKLSKGEIRAREAMAKEAEKILAADAKALAKKEKDDAKEQERRLKEDAKEKEKRLKDEAKAQTKENEKREKELIREREKKEKEDAREKEKRDKEETKAREKKEKEEAKEKEKQEKELIRARDKREKEEAKKKKGKGVIFDDYDYESDSDSESDYSDSESDYSDSESDYSDSESDYSDTESDSSSYFRGGSKVGDNIFQKWVDKDESDDEFSVASISELKDEDARYREKDELEGDELLEKLGGDPYKRAINDALEYLKANKERFLDLESLKIYSPKFLAMIESIQSNEHPGLHLVYSQFRSMEGIGIFSLALEANGYARFKIKRAGADAWEIDMSDADLGKPTYALYTGTEDSEEREIIRNIYNGDWNYIPNNISTQLRARSTNNNMGEIVKVLMITSAGSEGINLRNTRYVHIMEPYWHPVRLEQVIGRARRICSHQGLEEQYRTVEVFIYLMVFTKAQLDSDSAIELKLKDYSKAPPYLPQSSDENLFEISVRKEKLSTQLLMGIKESSVDCATHSRSNAKEGIQCLRFDKPTINDYAYNPELNADEIDAIAAINRKEIDWESRAIKYTVLDKDGKSKVTKFILRVDNNDVYDYDSVMNKDPRIVGKFVKSGSNYVIEFL
jgi:hypothetical protein